MKDNIFRGTETERNLLKAFAGEAQALTRYGFFAEAARDEGYEEIARIFRETAENERHHARQFFGLLGGGLLEIAAAYPAGYVGNTLENLAQAAAGEYDEWADLYPVYGKVAREEGFPRVGMLFDLIIPIEQRHEIRYRTLFDLVREKVYFSSPEPVEWECMECGFRFDGKNPPERCPVCGYPKGYFRMADRPY